MSEKLRPVMTMKPVYTGNIRTGYDDVREGVFHAWGVEYEEFESGPGNYTVAIVEYPDGNVDTVMPGCIRFLDGQDVQDKARADYFASPAIGLIG